MLGQVSLKIKAQTSAEALRFRKRLARVTTHSRLSDFDCLSSLFLLRLGKVLQTFTTSWIPSLELVRCWELNFW